jgi:hypothetical protein
VITAQPAVGDLLEFADLARSAEGRPPSWVGLRDGGEAVVDGRHPVVRVAGRDGTVWVSHQAWKSARPVH